MIVLDASVVLVALLDEDGLERVGSLIETQSCAMSMVNHSEVHDRLIAAGKPQRVARAMFDELEIRLLPFGRIESELTAALRTRTSPFGLGIADRACIATGVIHDAPIFTADRAWEQLDLPGIDIEFVR